MMPPQIQLKSKYSSNISNTSKLRPLVAQVVVTRTQMIMTTMITTRKENDGTENEKTHTDKTSRILDGSTYKRGAVEDAYHSIAIQ
jgi:hypothetical protein